MPDTETAAPTLDFKLESRAADWEEIEAMSDETFEELFAAADELFAAAEEMPAE
jgi:hypothetical protein